MNPRSTADHPTLPIAVEREEPLQAPAAGPEPHPRAPVEQTLIDQVLTTTSQSRAATPLADTLDRFLHETTPARALCLWLGLDAADAPVPSRESIARRLSHDIAQIDLLVDRQVNAILHHPDFQKLEASWRGLAYLVDRLPENDSAKIKVLNISWAEVVQDQTRALEFDQSQLFRKVYEGEFGHPGGEPFGVLLGDYEIRHRPAPGYPYDDLEVLSKISGVAAASFAPFLTGIHPSVFGLDSFTEMERPLNLSRTFEQTEYVKWRSFRQTEDARFVGLVLPRMLMRLPYGPEGADPRRTRFREDVEGPDRSKYLWGNAVYAFGAVMLRCFLNSGWLAEIRGVRQGLNERGARICLDDGGLVTGLPVHSFGTDRAGLAIKCSTEVVITDPQEKELDELGFIALCHCQDTEFSAFYGNSSVQKPLKYDDPKATANAKLSSMLQYMLCVSRFAHYLKVMSRDKIGSMASPEDCELSLAKWLREYTTASDSAGPEVKAKYPLREAKVTVRERPDKPGCYNCVIHLRPHFQLDQMFTSMRLTTELAPGRPE